ncbi:MAG: hypothetical protein A2041_02295 [Bacteroidetes bacterium GWA2_31_9b]|nr:MAG: hypothetical protein A2041_02295 [Bacteroidetes bacterium GWA2_31_9b]
MKNKHVLFITTLFILLFNFNVKSQLYLGGEAQINVAKADVSWSSDDDYKNNQSTFKPRIGFLINEKAMLGIEFWVVNQKIESSNELQNFKTYSFSPFFRYSFPIVERISFFTHIYGSIGFGNGEVDYDNGWDYYSQEMKYNNYSVGFIPGFNLSLTKRINIELTLGNLYYNYSEIEYDDNNDIVFQHNMDFDLNSIGLGVSYIFKK